MYKNAELSVSSLLGLMEHMGALIDASQYSIRLLVEDRRWGFCGEATFRSDFHAFARGIAVEEAFECINDAFHWRENTLLFELVIENTG